MSRPQPETPETPTVAPQAPKSAERLLQVGELAQAVGKTVRAIHHYEELGLLEPDARSKGRFRLYDQDAVTRVRWISKLHDLGLSLTQIQELVESWEQAPSAGRANAAIREMYATRLDETRSQIARLHALEGELEASIAYLDACQPCDTTLLREKSEKDGGLVRERDLVRRGDASRAGAATAAACADHAAHPPEVGACKSCEMRERDAEPELVAGLLGRQKSKHL